MECMLFWFENRSSAYALGGVSRKASSLTFENSFNKTKAAIKRFPKVFPQPTLPSDFTFLT